MDNFETRKSSKKKDGFFYFDASNENLLVTKPESWFGKTLNFANPLAYIVVILGVLAVVLVSRLF
ncbi:MAG TPA: hypothetical protein VF273_08585 [Pelobium sp.]